MGHVMQSQNAASFVGQRSKKAAPASIAVWLPRACVSIHHWKGWYRAKAGELETGSAASFNLPLLEIERPRAWDKVCVHIRKMGVYSPGPEREWPVPCEMGEPDSSKNSAFSNYHYFILLIF